jgi:hypothetical protein
MKCPKCGREMTFVSVYAGSPYPLGHYKCECGFEVSKKS